MRIVVEGFGRCLLDLELLKPLLKPLREPAPAARAPDRDPHGTLAAQVEQASEPAPGFGFSGSIATVRARDT